LFVFVFYKKLLLFSREQAFVSIWKLMVNLNQLFFSSIQQADGNGGWKITLRSEFR